MPSFAPREQPIKKKGQLLQREMESTTAIRKNCTGDKLLKFIDKYRFSQLAMIKAKIHFLHEQEYEKKQTSLNIEKLESEIVEWKDKSSETIISEVKTKLINSQS